MISNPASGKVYLIHYVIKFVSDLQQVLVSGFLQVLWFLHEEYWSPLYNCNIVESGIKYYNSNSNPVFIFKLNIIGLTYIVIYVIFICLF